jgi:hypothetical protein
MILISVVRASKESHSGVASPQPLSKSKTGKHPKTVRPSRKSFIGSLTLISCIATRDEKLWTSLQVQPAAQKVRGPYKLSEDIPLPEGYLGHQPMRSALRI